MKRPHRLDIDGLRALAILPVVWFHSGLPGLPGGFTGVDTFFVISGFLISSIIHREVASGTFSFARFYERRVRRIAPALLVVLAATLGVGYALLLPWEIIQLGKSAVAAIVMIPNVFFWREAGYFALGEQVTPLLHTWSLGVEEQFYLFFPVVLIVAERLKVIRPTVVLIAAISFALCIFGTATSPSATFYLLPTRAWELMLGAMLAVGVFSIPQRFAVPASAIGVAMLVSATLFITKASAFPGWIAAIPAVGALLVIAAGEGNPVNQVIGNKYFVWVGNVSYSLYLWHWPVFAFLRHWQADTTLSVPFALLGIVLSFALAAASYRWIETPVRDRSIPYRRVATGAAAGAVLVAAIALLPVLTAGLPQRFTPQVLALANKKADFAPLAISCVDAPLDQIDQRCAIGPSGKPSFVLWGDSHAAALSEGVGLGLDRTGLVISTNSCVPTSGWTNSTMVGRDPANCRDRNKATLKRVLNDPTIRTVILSSYWASHARNGGNAMWTSVGDVVRQLQASGREVIVLAGIPEPGRDVPWAAAINQRIGRPLPTWACPSAKVPVDDVTVIDLSRRFCAYGRPLDLFNDANHPSREAGLKVIAPAISEVRR
ncbi:acyltransferase family protein [Sphingomonas sp. LY29]|uniref:acyltransferase family protein n=1 Tax=Sphingomonas sp. LY29 TaxID=3095341 RepID=UPI002D78AF07|nr:acyltransferase family protein [Sphingomonas sp. LY29]WRP25363.1 acyltransferase family protein [Sphingomonas sp. LY29]